METGVEVCIEYLTKWLMISRAMMLVTSAFLWDHVLYLPVFSTDKKKTLWPSRWEALKWDTIKQCLSNKNYQSIKME